MKPLLISRNQFEKAVEEGEDVLLLDATGAKKWDGSQFHPVAGGDARTMNGVPRFDLAGVGTIKDEALYPLPDKKELAVYLAAFGVNENTWIVFTCLDSLPWAARAWWILRLNGWHNVSLLGKDEDLAGIDEAPACVRTVDVEKALRNEDFLVVDVRNPEDYNGTNKTFVQVSGHIPGTVNVPIAQFFDSDGYLLPSNELCSKLGPLLGDGRHIIAMCGGGIGASMLAFLAVLCGKKEVSVYDGSMHAWVKDPSRPVIR